MPVSGRVTVGAQVFDVSAPLTLPPVASGWPDASNTGYRNAPGYTGTLKPGAGLTIKSNTTYVGYDFGWTSVGTRATPVTNVTFIGCRFRDSGAVLVSLFGSRIAFSWCSFEPTATAPPVANSQGYQYGILADGAYYTHVEGLTMDHCDLWGYANAVCLAKSTQAAPVVIRDCWIHDARNDGGVDHTDGIGELNGTSMSWVTIDHNTIVSKGNTNGIAFQGGPYSDFTVTDNLIGGWGYAVRIGSPQTTMSRITFTGNQWTAQPPAAFGPLYPGVFYTGNGNLWRNNRWSDGRYWTPGGPSATDYTG